MESYIYLAVFVIAAFLPSITAAQRNHRSAPAVYFMNFLSLAATAFGIFAFAAVSAVIGFVVAIIAMIFWLWSMLWSLTGNVEKK